MEIEQWVWYKGGKCQVIEFFQEKNLLDDTIDNLALLSTGEIVPVDLLVSADSPEYQGIYFPR